MTHGPLPLIEVARLVAAAARVAEFDDLAKAATAVTENGENARARYDFGCACVERGVRYLAVRPLARALELAPDSATVLSELVAALEGDGQHANATGAGSAASASTSTTRARSPAAASRSSESTEQDLPTGTTDRSNRT